jgi:predicted DNA-binding protein (UPF0251 family)
VPITLEENGLDVEPEDLDIDPEDAEALRLKDYLDMLVFHDTGIEMELDYYKAVVRFIEGTDSMPQITDYQEVQNG